VPEEQELVEVEEVEPVMPPPGGLVEVEEVEPVMPPPGGYAVKAVNELIDALSMAMKAVAKALGQEAADLPPVPKEVIKAGKVEQPIPPDIIKAVADILAMAAAVGGSQEGRYDLDVESLLSDDAGLGKLAIALELLAKDKTLLAKIKDVLVQGGGKAPPPAAAKPPPAPAPPPAAEPTAEEEMSMSAYM